MSILAFFALAVAFGFYFAGDAAFTALFAVIALLIAIRGNR